jgi:hypothetical protein
MDIAHNPYWLNILSPYKVHKKSNYLHAGSDAPTGFIPYEAFFSGYSR